MCYLLFIHSNFLNIICIILLFLNYSKLSLKLYMKCSNIIYKHIKKLLNRFSLISSKIEIGSQKF